MRPVNIKELSLLEILPVENFKASNKSDIGAMFSSIKILVPLGRGDSLALHQWWWRMLGTKCVGDNLKMLVTVSAILVTNTLYHTILKLAADTNIKNISPRSLFCRQHSKIVTKCKLPTSQCHEHDCSQTHLFHIGRCQKKSMQKEIIGLRLVASSSIYKNLP